MHKITGLHIELTNICYLKCPGCPRTEFKEKFPKKWENKSLTLNALKKFIDIDLAGVKITFCGNYGDPIYNDELFDIVDYFKEQKAIVRIVTNGSYKTGDWWIELFRRLKKEDFIVFSIDGSEHTNKLYRVNSDWNSISVALATAKEHAKCSVIWKYIPFNFNEHEIGNVQLYSENLGIEFKIEPSDRWNEKTVELKPVTFVGSREKFHNGTTTQTQVVPKCAKGDQHYISADGFYMSCCYVGDHRFYYKTEFGKQKKKYSITGAPMTELIKLSSNFLSDVNNHAVCQFNCPD